MKLIVFDCDGTLVDSQHMICAAMQQAYGQHGLVVPPRERLLAIVGLSLAEAFRTLAQEADHPVESLSAHYKLAFGALRQSGEHAESLYPGADTVVAGLAALPEATLGIATGKSQRGVREVLGRHGLYGYFSTIQTADDAPSKPHPAMLQRAMQAVGAEPAETVMIGDSIYDMSMAQAAGVAAVGVGWGYHTAAALQEAGALTVAVDFDALMQVLHPWIGSGTWLRPAEATIRSA